MALIFNPRRNKRSAALLVVSGVALVTVLVGSTTGFVPAVVTSRSLQTSGLQPPRTQSAGMGAAAPAAATSVGGLAAVSVAVVALSRREKTRSRPSARCSVRRCAEGEEAPEAPEEAAPPSMAATQLQGELDDLKNLIADKQASFDRLTLEVKNFRNRTRSELATARGQAAIPVIKELLPIADEYALCKQNMKLEGDGEKAIADRFDDLFTKMMGTWKKVGVAKMVAVGKEFNPEFHEAVSMIPSADYKEEVVCNELRAGWELKPSGAETAQVLRPALVCVSSGPGPA
mmetsp:Transcript_74693/g.189593  ORF Transcript_74693/g.189593 Transcript_74693/m.189593 type:complete len:288 (-) Transcript_74693:162-1025(-)